MPFYEYECRECHERWSVLLSLGQRDEVEGSLLCPACGEKGPQRQISGFSAATGRASTTGGGSCAGGGGGG